MPGSRHSPDDHAAVITGDDEIRRCRMVAVEWIGSASHRK
jgi:hypothetical protein